MSMGMHILHHRLHFLHHCLTFLHHRLHHLHIWHILHHRLHFLHHCLTFLHHRLHGLCGITHGLHRVLHHQMMLLSYRLPSPTRILMWLIVSACRDSRRQQSWYEQYDGQGNPPGVLQTNHTFSPLLSHCPGSSQDERRKPPGIGSHREYRRVFSKLEERELCVICLRVTQRVNVGIPWILHRFG